ncbi:MAG: sigma-70 family RNA polymerase sigma factor [Armatimonadota bacterium]|nr:sigma-70 family RNA polymerase sigma factor [Armatimonadota bacterium]MCX7778028.1 sigma-70 family RNA polymerase sigma factor [Armatimonadota bacterium]MDW8024974.1 sigma-70 family RNA polymerase sigma factor [Armatimonadota bacterium]
MRQDERIDREAEKEKFRLYRQTRDPKLRDELISANIELARRIARRYATVCSEPFEDLFQEACIGLISAVERYNPDVGTQFNTYATHVINGHLKHYIRDFGKLIKEPAWMQEERYRLNRAIEELRQKFHRDPEPKEIAEHSGMDLELVKRLLSSGELFQVESLDEVMVSEEGEEGLDSQLDRMALEGLWEDMQRLEDRLAIQQALQHLSRLQRKVIELFFYNELTKTEIARMLGISANYVTYLLQRGLRNLHELLMGKAPVKGKRVMERVDEVTGFFSEQYFTERLNEDLRRAQRYNFPVSVAYIVSPALKLYHRRWRTRHFNAVISKVAEVIRSNLREVDYVGRMKVNEFAIAMPHTTAKGAERAMERLKKKIIATFNGSAQERPQIDLHYAIVESPKGENEATELLIKAEREAKESAELK